MPRPQRLWPALAGLTLAASGLAAPACAASAAETAVVDVLHRFDAAFRNHDAAALKTLFYNQEIVWKITLSPDQVKKYRQTNKDLEPVTSIFGGYHLLDDERYKPVPIAERFYDPQVITDGQVATVTFDYDFTMNCKAINWGKETWQLVNTDAGWKILNLLYSGHELGEGPLPPRHAAPVEGCTPYRKTAQPK